MSKIELVLVLLVVAQSSFAPNPGRDGPGDPGAGPPLHFLGSFSRGDSINLAIKIINPTFSPVGKVVAQIVDASGRPLSPQPPGFPLKLSGDDG